MAETTALATARARAQDQSRVVAGIGGFLAVLGWIGVVTAIVLGLWVSDEMGKADASGLLVADVFGTVDKILVFSSTALTVGILSLILAGAGHALILLARYVDYRALADWAPRSLDAS